MKKLGGFLLVSLAMAIVAHSQTYDYTFNGAVDNKWNTVGNWNPASLPGSGDSVSINYGENKSGKVELENDVTVGDLNFYHNPAGWASSGFTGSGTINADSFTIGGSNGDFSAVCVRLPFSNIDCKIGIRNRCIVFNLQISAITGDASDSSIIVSGRTS